MTYQIITHPISFRALVVGSSLYEILDVSVIPLNVISADHIGGPVTPCIGMETFDLYTEFKLHLYNQLLCTGSMPIN
ncbi:hypothetical protein L9F63_008655, partial [Diploptera punctata]